MTNKGDIFKEALEGKNLPPLTLDNKWYKLFKQAVKTDEISRLEAKLQELLKRQAHLNDELHKLKNLKNKIMNDIMENMDNKGKAAEKKKAENLKLMDEIKQKLEDDEDEMIGIPREIDQVNKSLMIATMEQCYIVIDENTDSIKELDDWITDTRRELKKNVVRKQEMEIRNVEIYSYMNDIFGPSIVELFDIRYDIENKKQELLEKQRALKEQKELEKQRKEVLNNGATTDA